MYLDALIAALLLYFGLAGLLRGVWSTLFGLCGFVTGYALAFLYARPLGERIAAQYGLLLPLCTFGAGVGIFLSASFFWGLVAWWQRRRAKKQGKDSLGGGERFAGLMLGLGQGAVFGFLLVWGASLIPKDNPKLADLKLNESVALAMLGPMTAPFTSMASQVLTGDADTGRVLSQTLLNREAVEKKVSDLTRSPVFADLAADPGLQEAFQSGNLENLGQQPAFRRVMDAPETKDLIRTLGGGSGDTAGIERGVEKILAQGGQIAHRMRNDERLQGIAQDPEVKALIEKRDFVSLLQHPRIAELLKGVDPAKLQQP